jgi:hypothetical protein
MQARTASNATEWHTFIRNILGWRRADELQINVPDMSVSVLIANPFEKLEASQNEVQDADDTEQAMLKTMQEEQAVAQSLIRKCLDQLQGAPEWGDILDSWTKHQRIGLAWKRYDRLEWTKNVRYNWHAQVTRSRIETQDALSYYRNNAQETQDVGRAASC